MNQTKTDLSAETHFQLFQTRLTETLAQSLKDIPSFELKQAMSYTLFNGGKHLRPLLIYTTGAIFSAPLENLDMAAAAVEMLHTYSLIHDDLPCMDNADLRRGKPTSHKVYGEGLAVLAGDALLTFAMQIITDAAAPLKAERRLQMLKVLTQASGPYGMVAGQTLDISEMNDANISPDLLLNIYKLKTGALFTACIELGRLASQDESPINQAALQQFGDCIGLAFQIQDDILDIESNHELLGKPQGLDLKNNKITYPALMGIAQAKDKVQNLYSQGLQAIRYLGEPAHLLRELTADMLIRKQ